MEPPDQHDPADRDAPGQAPQAPIVFVGGGAQPPCDLSRTLKRTFGQIAQASTLGGLADCPPSPLVLIDYDALTPQEQRDLLQGRTAAGRRPTVLLSRSCAQRDLVDLFGARVLTNMLVVNEAGADVRDLLVTVQKLRLGEIFGIEKYFSWGVETRTRRVTSSDERGAVLDEVTAYAARLGVVQRLRMAIRVAADELLTNALYNAPVTADGTHRFASWPRTRPVLLDPHESIEVRYCCDGRRFGLSVVDPFGTLAPSRVQDYLARALRRGDDQVRETRGGAGLGLYQVLDALSHFVVNVEPGARTEMIGLLDVSGSYRTFASSGKSFNIFVKGAAQ